VTADIEIKVRFKNTFIRFKVAKDPVKNNIPN
jgi:hypothetical protein